MDTPFPTVRSASFSSRIPEVGELVVNPRPEDVVATKVRTWHAHEGNVFYRELVDRAVRNTERSDMEGTRRVAERIVDIITLDRKGVFLRESQDCWVVMDHKQAVAKAVQAIRNCRDRDTAGSWKNIQKVKQRRLSDKQKAPYTRCSYTPSQVIYQAQSGAATTVNAYALQLISAACNRSTPNEALLVLESPMQQYLNGSEPSRERAMRLQLRHRYVAAISSGLLPIDFSRKLLDFWGGTLEQISPGATEEPGETEALASNASYKDATTAVIANDTAPSMETVPVLDGAASSSKKECSCIVTSPVVKARAISGKKESDDDVIVLAASI